MGKITKQESKLHDQAMDYFSKGENMNYQQLKRCVEFGGFSEEGIIYDEELAGPDGMSFYLYPAPWHTQEDINATTSHLRAERDVVHIIIRPYKGKYPLPKEVPTWTPVRKEAAFRKIVAERSMGWVEDCPSTDIQSANAVVTLLDNLSAENKEKYLKFPASKMISLAWDYFGGKKDGN